MGDQTLIPNDYNVPVTQYCPFTSTPFLTSLLLCCFASHCSTTKHKLIMTMHTELHNDTSSPPVPYELQVSPRSTFSRRSTAEPPKSGKSIYVYIYSKDQLRKFKNGRQFFKEVGVYCPSIHPATQPAISVLVGCVFSPSGPAQVDVRTKGKRSPSRARKLFLSCSSFSFLEENSALKRTIRK